MEDRGLRQRDLVAHVPGSSSVASDVLNGRPQQQPDTLKRQIERR
jgi:antitoxin component HigA of HigAB toxin-antitoxin module